ncbi:hypothetical protein ACIBQ1_37935 [Nonomuraea sp. NPDC050153]|uniref:hypothetical protein n=1 Tax=Nonomuraea sp. NPDC050153 TaxID=3364359 RepID=UPI0037965259
MINSLEGAEMSAQISRSETPLVLPGGQRGPNGRVASGERLSEVVDQALGVPAVVGGGETAASGAAWAASPMSVSSLARWSFDGGVPGAQARMG